MNVAILLRGCDDETYFTMECTEEQREFLEKVAAKSQETSTYGCMPDMKISDAKPCKYTEDGMCDRPSGLCGLCCNNIDKEWI